MPESAREWLDVLNKRLDARRPEVDLYEAYYAGEHRLAFQTSRFRETFGSLFKAFADNWCALVVDASVERLAVEGFRFGGETEADENAWEIWQQNDLDAQSVLAHTEAVKCGESYVLVAPPPEGEKLPYITVEHPSQCIVAHAPGMRRRRQAALKKWADEEGFAYANVYLPDSVHHFKSLRKISDPGMGGKIEWREHAEADHPAMESHELGEVPMFALCNAPGMMTGGTSDLQGVIKPQDAINKLTADMLIASEFAAYPQRWATGLEVDPEDPDAILHVKQWLASMANVWAVGDPEAKFGQFAAADLRNYTGAVEMLVQHIAAQTRTPPHYLLGQSGTFPSGESLKSTETGLVAKCKRKMVSFGDTWESMMRCAMRSLGALPANAEQLETLWRDPESRTTGEQTDAAVKELSIGIPRELIWRRRLGMSPQEIQQAKAMKFDEDLQAALVAPAPMAELPPASSGGNASQAAIEGA